MRHTYPAQYRATGLAALIEAQGRRKDWVAAQIAVHPSYISKLIRGTATVNAERAAQIAAVFQVPASLVFTPVAAMPERTDLMPGVTA